MTRKRHRTLCAKPGELKIAYGKDDDGNIDVCYVRGEHVAKADGWLLYHVLGCERFVPSMAGADETWEPSLLKQLEERGYDITTLKFSIQKKACDATTAESS